MRVEMHYLAPCLLGLVAGFLIGGRLPAGPPPPLVQAIGASWCGYLVGGGTIWATRILGSLAFGKEAMGLGDVHLMGAVGAVLGWLDPVLVFFIAPFSGLAWALLSMGLGSVFRKLRRVLPYGPHLALATLVVILCRPGINRVGRQYFGPAWPTQGFVPPPPAHGPARP
jgi:leader peptidase (prepilin peptidase)/N-methyltransferase